MSTKLPLYQMYYTTRRYLNPPNGHPTSSHLYINKCAHGWPHIVYILINAPINVTWTIKAPGHVSAVTHQKCWFRKSIHSKFKVWFNLVQDSSGRIMIRSHPIMVLSKYKNLEVTGTKYCSSTTIFPQFLINCSCVSASTDHFWCPPVSLDHPRPPDHFCLCSKCQIHG